MKVDSRNLGLKLSRTYLENQQVGSTLAEITLMLHRFSGSEVNEALQCTTIKSAPAFHLTPRYT